MTRLLRHKLARFRKEEDGAAMVEFAMVCLLFFFLIFGAIDFGIFASYNMMAEKATNIAARIAVTREPACEGVPRTHKKGTANPLPRYGTNCRAGSNICAVVAEVSCVGETDDDETTDNTAEEIWKRIEGILPAGTEIDDLTFTYTQDPEMGYLGGPYTAMVTVELDLPAFNFFSPISNFIAALGGTEAVDGLDYRTISISLPAEDLGPRDKDYPEEG